jgi:hypothetical protein
VSTLVEITPSSVRAPVPAVTAACVAVVAGKGLRDALLLDATATVGAV